MRVSSWEQTSSGAIYATMVPDSKKMIVPCVVAGAAKWLRDLAYERFFVYTVTKEFCSCCWAKWQKNVVRKDLIGKF